MIDAIRRFPGLRGREARWPGLRFAPREGYTPPPPPQVAPAMTQAPSISGGGLVGDRLTLDVGAASGAPAPTAVIEWLRGDVVITGANGVFYDTVTSDASMPVKARVKWVNSAGTTAFVATNAIVMTAAQPSQNVDVEFPGLIANMATPPLTVQHATPAGWSSADPHWDAVVFLADFERFLGADQSEIGVPYDFTAAAKIPTVTTDGMVFDGTQRYVTEGSAVFGTGGRSLTVEAVGLLPGAAGTLVSCHKKATPADINWSIGWQADPAAWVITIWNAGVPLVYTVPDTAPVAPVDLCIEFSGGTARLYRGGALLDTRAAGDFIVGNTTTNALVLAVGGGSATNVAMTIKHLRITDGVARYGAAYTPAAVPLTAPKSLSGGHRVGWGYWTQTSKDSLITFGGKALLGITSRIGAGLLYDPVDKRVHGRAVALWDEKDAHNQPTFLRCEDGRILTLATGHTYDKFYRGISSTPDDWLSTPSFDNITSQFAPATRFTYMKLFQLEGEPGDPIFLSTRVGNNSSTYREMMLRSLDGGQTFQFWNYLDAANDARRMYPVSEKTGPSRADYVTTAGNMGDTGGNEGIYHMSFDGTSFRDSQGNALALPIVTIEDATSLYGKWVEGLESNLKGIQQYGNRLMIVYTIRPPGGRMVVMRAMYDLANPGPWEQEYISDSMNGFAFHPVTPDNVFVTVAVPGKGNQVVELARISKGKWQTVRVLTNLPAATAPFDMLTSSNPDLLFMPCGRNTSYKDYASVMAVIELGGAPMAPVATEPPQLPAQVMPGQTLTLTSVGKATGYPTPAPHVTWTLDGQTIGTGPTVAIPSDAGGKVLAVSVAWVNSSGTDTETVSLTVVGQPSLLYLNAAPVLQTQFTIEAVDPNNIRLRTTSKATRSAITWGADVPVGSIVSFDWQAPSTKNVYISLSPTADAAPKENVVVTSGASGTVSYTVTQANNHFMNIVLGSGRSDAIVLTNFKITAP